MPINTLIKNQVIKTISDDFKIEAKYYTVKGVATTPHAVGEVDKKESWTKELSERKLIASPSEGVDRYIELERTLTALYCYYASDDYSAFIEVQKNNPDIPEADILSQKSFLELSSRKESILQNDKDREDVLKYLIVYSDLGKSPVIKEAAMQLAIKKELKLDASLDADGLMGFILKEFNDEDAASILPSFSKLSENAKNMLREFYPIMQACFGHMYFLERGKKTFDVIHSALLKISPKRRQLALDLVYLAQFYDAAGAQGQRKIAGSLTCTESLYKAYHLMYDALNHLQGSLNDPEKTENAALIAFNHYLSERAKLLGFMDVPLSVNDQFLTRLCCTLRGVTPEMGRMAAEEFKLLKEADQKLLTEQLDFSDQGLEGWSVRVNYAATIMLNLSRKATEAGKTRQSIADALRAAIVFAKLIEKTTKDFAEYVHAETPISFGEIAALANAAPDLFLNADQLVEHYFFDPKLSKIIKKTNEVSGSFSFAKSSMASYPAFSYSDRKPDSDRKPEFQNLLEKEPVLRNVIR
jgi:uncharacterized protein DUF6829